MEKVKPCNWDSESSDQKMSCVETVDGMKRGVGYGGSSQGDSGLQRDARQEGARPRRVPAGPRPR